MSVASDAPAADSTALDTAAQQALLDYVNSAAAVTSYATAVTQTQLPTLVLTPDWYGSYITSFEEVQAHALTWLNGLLPELSALPGAVVDADPLVQLRLTAVSTALTELAADPTSQAAQQTAQAALLALQSILQPVQQALDNLDANLLEFVIQLGTDLSTLQSMADAADSAAEADQAEVAKLTGLIAELRAAIANQEEIAHLQNMLNGDLVIFVVVVAATIGWVGGPIIDGLLGMALIATASAVGPRVAASADVTDLQDEITNVQQEISTESVEIAAIQSTVAGFEQLVGSGAGTQQALAEVTGNWTSQTSTADAVLADLSNAQADVSAEQVTAAQAAIADLSTQWASLVEAMQLLSGVSTQVASQPVAISQS